MNTLNTIPIIWFDGLHRWGKGTQIELLKIFLAKNWRQVFSAKGHGSREWLGENPEDNKSERRKQNYLNLKDKNFPNYYELWREAWQRLQRELKVLQYKISKDKSVKKPIILLDRTVLSRYHVERQKNANYDFDNLLSEAVIPDIIFVISCDIEHLKNRFTYEELQTKQWQFRRNNLVTNAPVFEEITNNLPEPIKDNTIIINGLDSVDNVHKNIIQKVEEKFL